MNKELLEKNKAFIGEDKVKKQLILENLEPDQNDQLAIIFNVLEENLDLLKEGKAKDELVAYLTKRRQAKELAK